jgi:hypothetical protein
MMLFRAGIIEHPQLLLELVPSLLRAKKIILFGWIAVLPLIVDKAKASSTEGVNKIRTAKCTTDKGQCLVFNAKLDLFFKK